MYNRQKTKIEVLQASSERDAYGYKSDEYIPIRTSEAAIMLYAQNNTTDVRYKDVTHTALTSDKNLTDSMRISDKNNTYDIVLVNNTGKLTQLFLKEVRT